MSKFKIGDPVKIKNFTQFSLYCPSVNDDDLHIHHIFKQPNTKDNAENNIYAIARYDGLVLTELFNEHNLDSVPETMVPIRELDILIENLGQKYSSLVDNDRICKACTSDFMDNIQEIINKYKDSE